MQNQRKEQSMERQSKRDRSPAESTWRVDRRAVLYDRCFSFYSDREVSGDLIMGDMGDGVPFRAGTFDGAISISALQWLCNVDKSYHNPVKRLAKFFSGLYAALSRGSRAVFQFYPESGDQVDLITQQAMKAGFTGESVRSN